MWFIIYMSLHTLIVFDYFESLEKNLVLLNQTNEDIKKIAECQTTSLKKTHFSHSVLEMALASPDSLNCVFLADNRENRKPDMVVQET